jgi:hypothetical protein
LNRSHRRAWTVAGVAIYAIFLLIAQFEHHDLLCHLKTPQHCTSCSSSLVGSDPSTPAAPGALQLRDAGSATSLQLLPESTLLTVSSTGRSPPTAI